MCALSCLIFLTGALCLSAGRGVLRLTRLPRHDRGPVPGGNRSAASCLCTVLRRALYHYSTRSPVCTFLFELQKLANLQCCLFCFTVRAEEFSKVCLTLAPGHTLSRVLTLCGLVLIVVHTLSKRCLLTLEEPALGPSWVICQHTVCNTRYCARASCDCRRHCTV